MHQSRNNFFTFKLFDDSPSTDIFSHQLTDIFDTDTTFEEKPTSSTELSVIVNKDEYQPLTIVPQEQNFEDISDIITLPTIPVQTTGTLVPLTPMVREIITLPKIIFYETKKTHVLQIFRSKLDTTLDDYFTQIVNSQQKIALVVRVLQNSSVIDKMLQVNSILSFDNVEDCYKCSIEVLTTSSRNKKLYVTLNINNVDFISNEFKIQNHPPRKRKLQESEESQSYYIYTSLETPPIQMNFQLNNLEAIQNSIIKKLKSQNRIKPLKTTKDYTFCYFQPELNDWVLLTEIEQLNITPKKLLLRSKIDDFSQNIPSLSTLAIRVYKSELPKEILCQLAIKFKPFLAQNSEGLLWFSFSAKDGTLVCLTCYSSPEQAKKSMQIAHNWILSSETSEFNYEISQKLKLITFDCVPFRFVDNPNLYQNSVLQTLQ